MLNQWIQRHYCTLHLKYNDVTCTVVIQLNSSQKPLKQWSPKKCQSQNTIQKNKQKTCSTIEVWKLQNNIRHNGLRDPVKPVACDYCQQCTFCSRVNRFIISTNLKLFRSQVQMLETELISKLLVTPN
jgi:hypothetical protein